MTTSTPGATTDRLLSPSTSMDAVTLRVGDLELMTSYYTGAFALAPLEERSRGTEVHRVLGRGTTPMLRLVHTPGLPAVDRRQAGLFHTAFLFDDAASLAATVYRAAQDRRGAFVGSSDHLVSEAFYFTDPEGNGVELYWDRLRTEWSWAHGQVRMDTIYLDPNRYLREHLTEEALAGSTARDAASVGHVHLSVGDVRTARAFYVDALGFDATASLGDTALFVSAGGYHHHMAMNVWNSRGAGPRMPALGLGRIDLTLPDADAVGSLEERLRDHGFAVRDDGRTLSFDDPWNNALHAVVAGA
ncbi:MAG: VOC family protein [Cellulosimicrobium cellulans]